MRSRLWPILLWPILVVVVYGAAIAIAQNDDPRGDLYSAKAIQALEQCFDSLGNFTCGGGGLTGTGEANAVARWTDVSTLAASAIATDNGTSYTIDTSGTAGLISLLGGGAAGDIIIDNVGGSINIGTNAGTVDLNFGEVGGANYSFQGGNMLIDLDGTYALITPDDITLTTTTILDLNGLVVSVTPTNLFFVQTADASVNFQVNPSPSAGSGGSILQTAAALNAMNGSDIIDVNLLSVTNADHTGAGNRLQGFNAGAIATPDAQVVTSGYSAGIGWDSFLTTEVDVDGWSADDDPPANSVSFYLDESGANCNYIARLSNGTEIVVAALVVAGNCP